MSCYCPFRPSTSLAALAIAATVLLTPASIVPVQAQAAQQATLSDAAKADAIKAEAAKPQAVPAPGAGNVAAVDASNPSAQKGLTGKAIDRVKEVAKSAGDIFSRVPCLPSKGGGRRWERCRVSRASWPRASRW